MNPGGATSAASMTDGRPSGPGSRTSLAARSVAISSGARRYGRASFMARFVARSPWSGSAGRSTSTAGRWSAASSGRAPLRTASSQAR